jgi:hypothetical protein
MAMSGVCDALQPFPAVFQSADGSRIAMAKNGHI